MSLKRMKKGEDDDRPQASGTEGWRMIDIDAEFRRAMGNPLSTANVESDDREALTVEKMREVKRKLDALGPPPPEIRLSKYAPVFVQASPSTQPSTDDMRAMCEDLGPQKVSGGLRITSKFGDIVVMNPAHFEEEQ